LILDKVFGTGSNKDLNYAILPDSLVPIFTQYGRNIYASDIVQNCIDCIATECSKLQPKHIRKDPTGRLISLQGDSINRLFRFAPNPVMNTREFIEKVIWNYELNYNAFIYPEYEVVFDSRGFASRNYTAVYPLNPSQVDFLQDPTGAAFVKMYFLGGKNFTLPYADIIHVRKKFSVNDVMGGGYNGQPDNTSLSKTLTVYDSLIQGVAKAVNASLNVRGILKLNTMLEGEKQAAERVAFEKQITENAAGIITGDFKGDFQPISLDPKIIDASTLEFIENKLLRWFGISLPILNGNYTDDEYQSFYNKKLEPIILGLGQAFSNVMFTPTEQSYNHEIIFYPQDLNYLSTASKIRLLEIVGAQGLLTDDQKLGLLGYPPVADGTGNRRTASLNFIDINLVNEYQLARAGIDSQTPNTGGNEDGKK
jgi:HK97 family phage portal protein